MDTDITLVEKILTGDMDAFSTLISRYQNKLYNFLFKMTLSSEDAEEILQEVFIKVYKNIYRYNSKYSFSTWIYSIALNTFKSDYRRKAKFRYAQYDDPMLLASLADSPEIAYESKELHSEVISLIDALNFEQRAALILKCVQGFSYKEIGEILKISENAAKMKVYRAKQTICKNYEEYQKRGVLHEV